MASWFEPLETSGDFLFFIRNIHQHVTQNNQIHGVVWTLVRFKHSVLYIHLKFKKIIFQFLFQPNGMFYFFISLKSLWFLHLHCTAILWIYSHWLFCHLVGLLTLIALTSWPLWSCHLVYLLTLTDPPSDGFTHLDGHAIWWIYSLFLSCYLIDLLTLIVLLIVLQSGGFTHIDCTAIWWFYSPWLFCHLVELLTLIFLSSGWFNALMILLLNFTSGSTAIMWLILGNEFSRIKVSNSPWPEG